MSKKKSPVASIQQPQQPPTTRLPLENIVVMLLANEHTRIVRDTTTLITNIETNLNVLRGALKRNDIRSLSRYVEPFDAALSARAESFEDFNRPIQQAIRHLNADYMPEPQRVDALVGVLSSLGADSPTPVDADVDNVWIDWRERALAAEAMVSVLQNDIYRAYEVAGASRDLELYQIVKKT